ncbi:MULTISPECIES: nucleotidyltransferase family protein [Pseudanabaena]|uniref:nucleotidyltransferase family protein n=1 Tax=Pseudanabaena TaxID=1152 RepID=UPI00247AAB82|nr:MULTISPECIES: nucleotidyltransferase family protein [Pseudanabaena]MEA5485860.1 nucleotidyltransferase family protein [Pseudanabaena sp. CCNP1317]WGS72250.1 nucleotidyltransferase family protein [Pseudanabaena galeata CCNP1313]
MTQPIEQKIKSLARADVMKTLSMHRHELKRLGVKSLRLFGSVARDEARPDSDIDFLVEFVSDPSFFELFEVQYFLENVFHCKIDLGMEESLKEHLREPVLKDVIHAL